MLASFAVWCAVLVVLFFFKQKTAYEMRISDWSSDVCSSDLLLAEAALRLHQIDRLLHGGVDRQEARVEQHRVGRLHQRRGGALCIALVARADVGQHAVEALGAAVGLQFGDRKSTRLNSSH